MITAITLAILTSLAALYYFGLARRLASAIDTASCQLREAHKWIAQLLKDRSSCTCAPTPEETDRLRGIREVGKGAP